MCDDLGGDYSEDIDTDVGGNFSDDILFSSVKSSVSLFDSMSELSKSNISISSLWTSSDTEDDYSNSDDFSNDLENNIPDDVIEDNYSDGDDFLCCPPWNF